MTWPLPPQGNRLLPLPHFFPGNPGFQHLRPRERLRIDLADVVVDDDEVGPFAGIEATAPRFRKSGIGSSAGQSVHRLVEVDPLFREPTARRLPVPVMPAD